MKGKLAFLFLTLLCSAFIFGCASTLKEGGAGRVETSQLEQTIEKLSLAVEKNPQDGPLMKELGIALYRHDELAKAIPILKQAQALNPQDGQVLFYLGTAYEIQGDLANAIQIYKQHNQISRYSRVRRDIEARLNKLMLDQMKLMAQQALANEKAIDLKTIPQNTVAVVYFKYLGKDTTLMPLQKGLAALIITDLSQIDRLTLIERLQVQKLFEEMGLGMTGLVNAATAPRVGKLVGAATVVNGAFVDLAKKSLSIDAGFVETISGQVKTAKRISGALATFYQLEKNLVFDLLEKMHIPLTLEEKDRIRTIPTENLLAFLAYCKGLDYSDRGLYQQASEQFDKALQLDKNFNMANQERQRIAGIQTNLEMTEMVRLADIDFQNPAGETAVTERAVSATAGAASSSPTAGSVAPAPAATPTTPATAAGPTKPAGVAPPSTQTTAAATPPSTTATVPRTPATAANPSTPAGVTVPASSGTTAKPTTPVATTASSTAATPTAPTPAPTTAPATTRSASASSGAATPAPPGMPAAGAESAAPAAGTARPSATTPATPTAPPSAGSGSLLASPMTMPMDQSDFAGGLSAFPTAANPSIMDRLEHTQSTLSTGFLPSIDSREPSMEASQQTFGSSATIEIEIRIPQQ